METIGFEDALGFIKRLMEDRYFSDAMNSIARNAHMNELEGKKVELRTIKRVLNAFFEDLPWADLQEAKNVGEFLDKAIIVARRTRTKFFSLEQKVVDAILADFLNYLAASQGGDLGFYTKHFRKD